MAAGAPPTSDDVEMGGGDTGGDRGDDTPNNSGIVAECTITPILQDDGQPVRELVPPQQQQTSNYQPMPPPPLQRLDIAYDPMTNNSYQNL